MQMVGTILPVLTQWLGLSFTISVNLHEPAKQEYNGWDMPDSKPTGKQSRVVQTHTNTAPSIQATIIPKDLSNEGPIHHPSVESSPVPCTLYTPTMEGSASVTNDLK